MVKWFKNIITLTIRLLNGSTQSNLYYVSLLKNDLLLNRLCKSTQIWFKLIYIQSKPTKKMLDSCRIGESYQTLSSLTKYA